MNIKMVSVLHCDPKHATYSLILSSKIDQNQTTGKRTSITRIIKDSQPFSVVEDIGFKELVAKLDPSYTLLTRQAVKTKYGQVGGGHGKGHG